MTWEYHFILVFGVFVGLMLAGLWIPLAIGISAVVYLYVVGGWSSFNALGLVSWSSTNHFTLTSIPMFILMAELMLQSGLSHRLYIGLSRIVRRLPGGLLQVNIAGCAIFAAISGSSVATAAAIGTVALPQLMERKYDRKISAGSLAAGGTLGILIPPSIAMIIYGNFTEASIAKLFMAGLVPGVVLAGFYMIYIALRAFFNPALSPQEGQSLSPREILYTLYELIPLILLIGSVLGSIYLGLATPTEVAAFGCSIAVVFSLIWSPVPFREWFRQAVRNSIRISATIMFIVWCAYILSYAVGIGGLGKSMANWLIGLHLDWVWFMLAIIILYSILGCLMDSIGMIVITVPLLHPTLIAYGVDTIWFGVLLVLLIELGQITPPFGINLFVIRGIWKGGTLEEVTIGSVPFYFIMYLMMAILFLYPELALWLPSRMIGR